MPKREVLRSPKLFKIGRYLIFFWSNENDEPVHVHIAVTPSENATKIWLTKNGGCVVSHNRGKIPMSELRELLDVVSTRYFFICSEWKRHFNVTGLKFYC
jgi:hypothetical protein